MDKEIGKAVASSAVVTELYKDLIQPSARRVGLSFDTVAKVTLSPIAIMEWGYEKSADWLRRKIDSRLSSVPPEYVTEPKANIAYEALRHIATSHDTPELRDLYAELLMKAMDVRTAETVHPAYFHVIEQLAPQEALVLVGLHTRSEPYFTDQTDPWGQAKGLTIEERFRKFCESVLLGSTSQAGIWLTNLCRLGLLALQSSAEAVFRGDDAYHHGLAEAKVDNYEHRRLEFTEFGQAFIAACAPHERISTVD